MFRIQMFDSMSFECILRVKVPSPKTPLVENRFDKCIRIKTIPIPEARNLINWMFYTYLDWIAPENRFFQFIFCQNIARMNFVAFTELFSFFFLIEDIN